MINLEKAVKNINRSLIKKQPTSFSPIWIKYRCKISHKFVVENIKDEWGKPDWDLIVSGLERYNQKLWLKGVKRKKAGLYRNKIELDVILNKYNKSLYTFLTRKDKEDRIICDWISIKLVRMAQRGNLLAKEKAVNLLNYLVDQWVERDMSLANWKGYDELITEHIEACIRRFRYAGSFLGYLYRTLEYSGRGLKSLKAFSLDDYIPETTKRRSENLVYDSETNETRLYSSKKHK